MFNHGLGGWLFARVPRANEVIQPKPSGRFVRMLASGTVNERRNEQKRKARADVKRCRAVLVRHHASLITAGRAPKRKNDSMVRLEMIGDRIVRQLRGSL